MWWGIAVGEILPALNTAVLPPIEEFALISSVVALFLLLGCHICIVRNNLSRVVCEQCPTQCHWHLSDRMKGICV